MSTATIQEAAQLLRLSRGAVRGLLATGYLKGEKVDKVWHISRDSLRVLHALLKVTPRQATPFDPAEQALMPAHLCPVCGGRFRAEHEESDWRQHEFQECRECDFSIHESLLRPGWSPEVHQRVSEYLAHLEEVARQGEAARSHLRRRAEVLQISQQHARNTPV